MQRKNSTIMNNRYKNGIAMIMAITVIGIMGTIMALSLSMTTQTTRKTADLYLYEQSMLLAKSATEYQLLRIAQNPPCTDLDTAFTQDSIYQVEIKTRYVYDSANVCTSAGGTEYAVVSTPEQNGTVLIDVSVSVDDATIVPEAIRYFRRTIQKL